MGKPTPVIKDRTGKRRRDMREREREQKVKS